MAQISGYGGTLEVAGVTLQVQSWTFTPRTPRPTRRVAFRAGRFSLRALEIVLTSRIVERLGCQRDWWHRSEN